MSQQQQEQLVLTIRIVLELLKTVVVLENNNRDLLFDILTQPGASEDVQEVVLTLLRESRDRTFQWRRWIDEVTQIVNNGRRN